jgi:hypothetical protein
MEYPGVLTVLTATALRRHTAAVAPTMRPCGQHHAPARARACMRACEQWVVRCAADGAAVVAPENPNANSALARARTRTHNLARAPAHKIAREHPHTQSRYIRAHNRARARRHTHAHTRARARAHALTIAHTHTRTRARVTGRSDPPPSHLWEGRCLRGWLPWAR